MSQDPEASPFIEAEQLRDLLKRGESVVIVDVRSSAEFAAGHVEGAINIPADRLEDEASMLPGNTQIVTVCSLGGQRSCNAAGKLKELGFSNTSVLKGGTKGWKEGSESV